VTEGVLKDGLYGLSIEHGAPPPEEARTLRLLHADPAANAARVKDTAKRLGAAAVGICRTDPNWLFAPDRPDRESLPAEQYPYTIVMAVAMDRRAIERSPAPAATAATSVGYMHMALCASALSAFIRQHGYGAVAAGNEFAHSVPLAVLAGLGEVGLNRLLITPELGPCVRLRKVFTDMPLEVDEPLTFGVKEFCQGCRRCLSACPAGAIPADWPVPGGPGVDEQKCRDFWKRNGNNCSICIAVCPFTAGRGRAQEKGS